MNSFWHFILAIMGMLLAIWFFAVWLPHRLHLIRVGLRHGWPSAKRAAIEKLFLDGTITFIIYTGASFNPRHTFTLEVAGPFGTFVASGTHDKLHVDPNSDSPPKSVTDAFSGYIDSASDVIWLLWYLPFLCRLQKADARHFKVGGDMPRSLSICAA